MAAPLFTTESGRLFHAGQILVVSVGLPARGKTHVSHSIDRYLRWLGVRVQVFSLGDFRRATVGGPDRLPADYFSTNVERRPETEAIRERVKDEFECSIEAYFKEEKSQVAIYDANNGTKDGRVAIRARFEKLGIQVMFIENVCDKREIIDHNIRAVKISSPDYKGWDQDKAVADYWTRIADHEKSYEPIEQPSFPYIKVINIGEKIIVNNISGYLQSRVVFYLMNIHASQRTIWFARSGPSRIEHSYKADSDLSPLGVEYAQRLARFMKQKRREVRKLCEEEVKPGEAIAEHRPLTVWTSARKRCLQTSSPLARAGYRVSTRSQMNEMNPGVIDGMSVSEIKEKYPEEYERSLTEPYAHRYPRAESYHDLSVRLEPVIFEMERDRNDLLMIGHASVIRCLFSYLKGLPPHDIPLVSIKRGQLIEVTPMAYGVKARTHTFWTPSQNQQFEKLVSYEDAFHHAPESSEKAEELNAAIAPLVI